MGRKLPNTPRSRIRTTLRRLWLYSRERAAAVKRAENRCEVCNALSKDRKGGTVTLEVHHNDMIEWEKVLDYIQRHILVHPDGLTVFCKQCHEDEHNA